MTQEDKHILDALNNKNYALIMCTIPATNWFDKDHPDTRILKVSRRRWNAKQMQRAWRLVTYFKRLNLVMSCHGFYIAPRYDLKMALWANKLI